MFIVGIIVLVFLAFAYLGLPLWAKLIILALNAIIPDPIPIVDEVFMVVSIIGHIVRLNKVMLMAEWAKKHKVLTILIVIALIGGIIALSAFIFQ